MVVRIPMIPLPDNHFLRRRSIEHLLLVKATFPMFSDRPPADVGASGPLLAGAGGQEAVRLGGRSGERRRPLHHVQLDQERVSEILCISSVVQSL